MKKYTYICGVSSKEDAFIFLILKTVFYYLLS